MSEQLPSPEIAGPIHYPFEAIEDDVTKLHAGDTVHFETFEQLDATAAMIVWMSFGHVQDPRVMAEYQDYKDEKSIHAINGWSSIGNIPSEVMKPRGFHGKFKNLSLTLLTEFGIPQDDPTATYKYNICQQILSADLYSTGRGNIGTAKKLLAAKTTVRPGGTLWTKYHDIAGYNAERVMDLLRTESASAGRLVALKGLERVVSAGLPGLGKRR